MNIRSWTQTTLLCFSINLADVNGWGLETHLERPLLISLNAFSEPLVGIERLFYIQEVI